jgi:hypothetical protein
MILTKLNKKNRSVTEYKYIKMQSVFIKKRRKISLGCYKGILIALCESLGQKRALRLGVVKDSKLLCFLETCKIELGNWCVLEPWYVWAISNLRLCELYVQLSIQGGFIFFSIIFSMPSLLGYLYFEIDSFSGAVFEVEKRACYNTSSMPGFPVCLLEASGILSRFFVLAAAGGDNGFMRAECGRVTRANRDRLASGHSDGCQLLIKFSKDGNIMSPLYSICSERLWETVLKLKLTKENWSDLLIGRLDQECSQGKFWPNKSEGLSGHERELNSYLLKLSKNLEASPSCPELITFEQIVKTLGIKTSANYGPARLNKNFTELSQIVSTYKLENKGSISFEKSLNREILSKIKESSEAKEAYRQSMRAYAESAALKVEEAKF